MIRTLHILIALSLLATTLEAQDYGTRLGNIQRGGKRKLLNFPVK